MLKKYIKKKSLKILANGLFYGFGIVAGSLLGYIGRKNSNKENTIDGDINLIDCGNGEKSVYASFDLPLDVISKKDYIRLKVNNTTIEAEELKQNDKPC